MNHKYVTQQDIDRYKTFFKADPIDLVHMVNWFAQGAVAAVSNSLFHHMEYDCHLEYDMFDWKHDCGMWKIVNDETEEEVLAVESLWELAVREDT